MFTVNRSDERAVLAYIYCVAARTRLTKARKAHLDAGDIRAWWQVQSTIELLNAAIDELVPLHVLRKEVAA